MTKAFLGRGWKFPVAVDATGKMALSEYEQDIRESVRLILLTAQGERVMRPDFGAGLQEFVFEPMNATTIGLMQAAIEEALLEWEPRIQLLSVEVEEAPGDTGTLLVNLDYRVRATNTQFNLVFPFYLGER